MRFWMGWVLLGSLLQAQAPAARPLPAPKAKANRKAKGASGPSDAAPPNGRLRATSGPETPADQDQLAKELRRKRAKAK